MGQEATLGNELLGYFVPGMGVGGIVFIILLIWFHYRLKEIKVKSCAALEKAVSSEKIANVLSGDFRVMTAEFKNVNSAIGRIEKNCRLETKIDKIVAKLGED